MDAGTGYTAQVYELSTQFLHKVDTKFLEIILFSVDLLHNVLHHIMRSDTYYFPSISA